MPIEQHLDCDIHAIVSSAFSILHYLFIRGLHHLIENFVPGACGIPLDHLVHVRAGSLKEVRGLWYRIVNVQEPVFDFPVRRIYWRTQFAIEQFLHVS